MHGGQWYHIETTVVGQTITTTIDGQIVDVTQNATYARGRVGFEENTADKASALYDNVRVTGTDGAVLLADDFSGDLSRFDPPLPRRFPISINPDSCGGQPTNVAVLPGTDGPIYLFQSDLWNHGDRNEALANYYWAPLSFDASGNIQPFECKATIPLTLTAGHPGMQTPPPDVDQTSEGGNFRTLCDVGGGVQRLQTFKPSRTGLLTKVTVTTFQNVVAAGFVHAPLAVDILRLGTPVSESSILATATFAESELQPLSVGPVGWAPRDIAMQPDIWVVAGDTYGIRVRSAAPQGCYGFAYNDSGSYARGEELYSTDGGSTFRVEPGYTLKFATYVSQSGIQPTSTPPSAMPSTAGTAAPATTIVSPATDTPVPALAWPSPIYTAIPTAPIARTTQATLSPAPTLTAPGSAPPAPTPTSSGASSPLANKLSPTPTSATNSKPPGASAAVPTATATFAPEARPARTTIPTRTPTRLPSTVIKKARRALIRPPFLTVDASPRTLTSGQRLKVGVWTLPRAHVTLMVQIPMTPVPARMPTPSAGKDARSRPPRVPSSPLYRVVSHATIGANSRGRLTYALRIAYNPAHAVRALLVVTMRAARGTVTRTLIIVIRPSPHGHSQQIR